MTDIKIIIDNSGPVCGDCTQYFDAHFESNPTLAEFAEHLANGKEWGEVRLGERGLFLPVLFEYGRFGRREIYNIHEEYESMKDRRIRLTGMSGGWSRMDYNVLFV